MAPVVEHGVASGLPYVAVAAAGQPWRLDAAPPLERQAALALAAQAARILRAVALTGVVVPDAAPERFCLTTERAPLLTLADLAGAVRADPDEAGARHFAALRTTLGALAVDECVAAASDLPGLIRALDRGR